MNVLISSLIFIIAMIISLSLPYFIVKIYAIKHNTSYDKLMNSDYGPYDMYSIGSTCDYVLLKNFFVSAFVLGIAMVFTCTLLNSNVIAIRFVAVLLVVIGNFITMPDLIVALASVVNPGKQLHEQSIKI